MSSSFNTLPPFSAVSEKDPINGQMYEFQSITKMPAYTSYSFEKLRYDDYMEKKKKQKIETTTSSDQEIATELFQRYDIKAEQNDDQSTNGISQGKNSYLSLNISSIYFNIMSADDSIDKKCCDVAIVMADSKVLCHKIILLCRSPVFKKLFEMYPDCKLISIPSIQKPIMELILQYVYTGQIDNEHLIVHDYVIDVFEAAILLQMKPLIEILAKIVSSTTRNVYLSAKIWTWTNKMYSQKASKNIFDNYFLIDEISANITVEDSTTGLDDLISDLHTKTKNLYLESFGMEIEKSTNYLEEQGPNFLEILFRLLEDTSSLLSRDATSKVLKWTANLKIDTAQKRQLIKKLAKGGSLIPVTITTTCWIDIIPIIVSDNSTDECVEFFFECCVQE